MINPSSSNLHPYQNAGLMNQAPSIYNVGLMNQAPTIYQIPAIHKVDLINQTSTFLLKS